MPQQKKKISKFRRISSQKKAKNKYEEFSQFESMKKKKKWKWYEPIPSEEEIEEARLKK